MAGSGIRGQFEEKFKALIRDIEAEVSILFVLPSSDSWHVVARLVVLSVSSMKSVSVCPCMRRNCVDETSKLTLDTLFNLGKAEGSIDAGQMIKPALARGLQLVGATTREVTLRFARSFSKHHKHHIADEYRKTIGKDAALERRFQPVQIQEPTVEATISILRGLKPKYEVHHGVEIADSALVTGTSWFDSVFFTFDFLSAAVYGARYISDRYLPDKAIDLVDEAASALRLAQESKPDELEALDREIVTLQIELESLKNETDVFSVERRTKREGDIRVKREEAQELTAIWQNGTISKYCFWRRLMRIKQSVLDSTVSRTSRSALKVRNTSSRSHNVRGSMRGPPSFVLVSFQN